MKSAIIALVKFNGIIILIFIALALYAALSGMPGSSIKIQGLVALLFAAWAGGNLKIIIEQRKNIVHSIKKGAIEAAAAVIEFKEIANLRAQERIKEKEIEPAKPHNFQTDPLLTPAPSTKEHMSRHNGVLMRVSDIPKNRGEI